MPFLDWVNKNQAKEATREVPYHLLKQEAAYGDVSGANAGNLLTFKASVQCHAGRLNDRQKRFLVGHDIDTQSSAHDDYIDGNTLTFPILREIINRLNFLWVDIQDLKCDLGSLLRAAI